MTVSLFALAAAALSQAQAPSGSPVDPAMGVPVASPVEALPEPERDPLRIDIAADPILGLARESAPDDQFLRLVQRAVDLHPRVDEAQAGIAEAVAAEDDARSGLFPTVDLAVNSQRTLSREFDQDPDNIIERSRSRARTDLTAAVQQTLWDFGATANRIAAAGARLRAASFQAEASADQVALQAIAAWYDVFAYRALVGLGDAFLENQQDLRGAIQTRIAQGVSAPGDLPRVESYIASAEADLSRYRRQLANAEARFEEMFGVPAPPGLGRAPTLEVPATTKDAAEFLARSTAQVESAAAIARAAQREARAERAALENSYIASRQSRDVLAERFRVARGTLFDLLESESGYFNVAATYIRSITELDAARYVLLSRTGRLLSTLDIDPPVLETP